MRTCRLPAHRGTLTAVTNDRPTKRLPPVKPTTYSVTNRRDNVLEVNVADNTVTIVVDGSSLTMSKTNARRLVARLLEKLG